MLESIRKSNTGKGILEGLGWVQRCQIEQGELDPIVGMAGNVEDLQGLPEAEQGTVAVVKCTLEPTLSAKLRSRVGTCSLTSGGKPGVDVSRFRPDGRLFAIGGWDKENKNNPAFTFKVTELDFHCLKDEDGFRPAPYLASRGMLWIQQYDSSGEKLDDLRFYITESHRLVSLGLTKKLQKELNLNQD